MTTTRPKLLDLFCGAGGAAAGYMRAGFDVVGVDIKRQPRFPGEFVQADALTFLDELTWLEILQFSAVHASPPCQAYSALRTASPSADYPDLVAATRERLIDADLPWVIENVPGSPLTYSVELCGSMFHLGAVSGDGVRFERKYRELRRHRLFETSFPILQPPCQHSHHSLGVYGHGANGTRIDRDGAGENGKRRRGAYQGSAAENSEAMGIDWMGREQLSQAIPPAYTEFIATELLREVDRRFGSVFSTAQEALSRSIEPAAALSPPRSMATR